MGIFFVGGINGVGKTTCCKHAATELHVPHYEASALIKTLDTRAVSEKTKSVTCVASNQAMLIQGVHDLFARGHHRFFLDGHFSVPSAKNSIERISLNCFRQLRLDGIAVYEDLPELISKRRKFRDACDVPTDEIAGHQTIEINHARLVARSLNIPFFKLSAFDKGRLLNAACAVWNSTHDG